MRLIDADEVHNLVRNSKKYMWRSPSWDEIRVTVSADDIQFGVDKIPTVDAEPVKHGHWIEKMIPTGVSAFGVDELTCEEEACSVCGAAFWVGENKKYCPNCGAKMDEEGKE